MGWLSVAGCLLAGCNGHGGLVPGPDKINDLSAGNGPAEKVGQGMELELEPWEACVCVCVHMCVCVCVCVCTGCLGCRKEGLASALEPLTSGVFLRLSVLVRSWEGTLTPCPLFIVCR